MRTVKGRQYVQDTKAVSELDLSIPLSNLFNAAIRGEQHERMLARYTSDDVFSSLKETLGPVVNWDITNAMSIDKKTTAEKLDNIQSRLGVIAAKLTDIKQHIPNFGQYILKYGVSNKLLAATGLASSGLPKGMDWVSGPTEPIDFSMNTKIPGPTHPASQQFGRLMAEWDRANFSTGLMSHKEEAGGFDVKDRVTGQQMVTIARAKMPHAHLIAYLMLIPGMYINFNWPFWTECLTILAATSSYWEDRLRLHNEWGKRKTALPQNQFTSLVASLNGQVKVSSVYGDKPLLFDGTGTVGSYTQLIDIGIELDKAMHQQLSTTWGDWSTDNMVDPYQMITQYESLGSLRDEVTRVTTSVGWSTSSAGSHEINLIGGDFIWSDGDHYSENPMTGLMGLKPVVAPNNASALIDDRRMEAHWNVSPLMVGDAKQAGSGAESAKYALRYSVMFVHGRQSITGDGSEIERIFIPSNAYLGEPGAERIRLSSSLEDPMTQLALGYYGANKLYIQEMYIEPDVTTDQNVYCTSWDTWATGADAGAAFNRLVSALPAFNVRPVAEVIFYRGKWFNHRFIVRMARPSTIRHYSPLGRFITSEKQDGHVDFMGGEITLGHSSAVLNALVMYGTSPSSERLLSEVSAGSVGA